MAEGLQAFIKILPPWADPPISKRGPLLRPVPEVVFPHRCRPSLGGSFVQLVPPPVSEAQANLLAGRKAVKPVALERPPSYRGFGPNGPKAKPPSASGRENSRGAAVAG